MNVIYFLFPNSIAWVLGMNSVDKNVCHNVKRLHMPDRTSKTTFKKLILFCTLTRMWHYFLHLEPPIYFLHSSLLGHVLPSSPLVFPLYVVFSISK